MVRIVKGYKEGMPQTLENRRLYGVPETWSDAFYLKSLRRAPTEEWAIKPLKSGKNTITVHRYLAGKGGKEVPVRELKEALESYVLERIRTITFFDECIDLGAEIELLPPHDKDAW
jgi:hypothetical protein